jgi:phosphoenolpyruvate carboxykinase (GTP)
VNWFRKGADGKFLWPGYGENARVLKWIVERVEGKADAEETPIGFVPSPGALTLDGLAIPRATMEELLRVNPADWAGELDSTRQFFERFGSTLPQEIWRQHEQLQQRLGRVTVPAT